MIYISKKDIWGKGSAVYTVEKSLKYHNEIASYDDKQYTLYINAEIKDTTEAEISALMEYFKTCDPNDNSQGALSEYVRYLKSDAKGANVMFEEFEENIEKRITADKIVKVMRNFKVSFDVALENLEIPKEEYDDYAELIQYFYPNVLQQ